MTEAWRKVWREGVAPQMPTKGLEALAKALRDDDATLQQGATTTPPPLQCVQDWDVEAACLIGFCGWKGNDLKTVAEVEEFFAKACFACDQTLGEAAAVRWLLNFYDDIPRHEMRKHLLPEVELVLRGREGMVSRG